MRACLVCGEVFQEKMAWQLYCSATCKDKNKGRIQQKACDRCGKQFMPEKRYQRFCSKECREQFHLERKNAQRQCMLIKEAANKTYGARACQRCGAEFVAREAKQKWCSAHCKALARQSAINPNHLPREERHVINTCKTCGKQWESTKARARDYCSRECGFQSPNRPAVKTYTCMGCGKEFKPRMNAYNKYCSRDCALRNRGQSPAMLENHKRQIEEGQKRRAIKKLIRFLANIQACPVCGNKFWAKGSRKYCSDTCFQATKPKPEVLVRMCEHCGTKYETTNVRRLYCSDRCGRRVHDQLKDLRRRSSMQENGPIDKGITAEKLMKRDKNTCHICGGKVDINADSNDGMYPTIDHIVPLSKGGAHTWGNVALAHRKCNTIKQASLIYETTNGQLALAV